MKKSRYLRQVQGHINKAVRKIRMSQREKRNLISKEEILIEKLTDRLGKSPEEVKGMISDGLMEILTMVPISEPASK